VTNAALDQAVAAAHFFDDPSVDLVMFTEEPFVGSGVHIFWTAAMFNLRLCDGCVTRVETVGASAGVSRLEGVECQ